MTREQAREAAKVMLAWSDGKETWCSLRKLQTPIWHQISNQEHTFDWSVYTYQLKPTATLRPWTADEVPLGAWMRFKRNTQDRVLLGWVSVQADRDMWLDEREHSTDGGLNWKPCGVEEVGK